jgi:alpha-amylase/alpha-mannosidase (GH57 family)
MKCVANFSGILLSQLNRYVESGWRDRYWSMTMKAAASLTDEEYDFIVARFFSLSWKKVVNRYPRYRALLKKREQDSQVSSRFSDAEITDLQVLFNLGWCGHTLRTEHRGVMKLVEKGGGYSDKDKEVVLDAHLYALNRVLEMWSDVVRKNQVEISVSAYHHPILPLLANSACAVENLPGRPLPRTYNFPEDAAFQVAAALDIAQSVFGERPMGMWPPEGSVSDDVVAAAVQNKLSWMASDEEVLFNSLGTSEPTSLYQHYGVGDQGMNLFFRDRTISDKIGFEYADMSADEAVDDLMGRLHEISEQWEDEGAPCVAVILDGENAWEHYDDDGGPFLSKLYESITEVDFVEPVLPRDYVMDRAPRAMLNRISPGSWIEGNFRIWIGSESVNLAWEELKLVREASAISFRRKGISPAIGEIESPLYCAQASDWFWWYGDDFSAVEKDTFDRLFRANISATYDELGLPVPERLKSPLSCLGETGGEENATSEDEGNQHALLSGLLHEPPDWARGCGVEVGASGGSMHRGGDQFRRYWSYFQEGCWLLRIEPSGLAEHIQNESSLEIEMLFSGHTLRLIVALSTGVVSLFKGQNSIDLMEREQMTEDAAALVHDCIDLKISTQALGLEPESGFSYRLGLIHQGGCVSCRAPLRGSYQGLVPAS